MSYEDTDKKIEIIRTENSLILSEFEEALRNIDLKDSTIKKHIQNVEFYINDYLLYDDCTKARDGVSSLDSFFNGFFPRKAMWSSVASMKSSVRSLKKFYSYLESIGVVDIVEYHLMLCTVNESMPEWTSHYKEEYE